MRRAALPPGVRRLRMNPWAGPFPLPGEFLATHNGRLAYLVLGVKPRPKAGGFHVDVEISPRAALNQADAVVHWFRWNKRGKNRSRHNG